MASQSSTQASKTAASSTDSKPVVASEDNTRTTSSTSDLGTNDASVAIVPASEGIPTTSEAIDPRTGEKFASDSDKAGGRVGFEVLDGQGPLVPRYDKDNLPVEITSHVMPSAKDELWAAVRVAAPNLTPELAATYGLGDDVLAAIARREVPPPPAVGPIRSSDLYLTPGGWQNVPAGVDPSAIGQNKIVR
jgi:hypothetical protein